MCEHGRHGGHKGELLGLASLAGAAGLTGGAYKFAEFLTKAKRLHDVGGENAVFIRLVQNVAADLRETERLLGLPEVKEAMRGRRDKVAWIAETVGRLRRVMESMGELTGTVAGDLGKEGGKKRWSLWSFVPFVGGRERVDFRHRLKWVLDEHEKLVNRRMELAMGHQSLVAVISFLEGFERIGCYERRMGGREEVDLVGEVFGEMRERGERKREEDERIERDRIVMVDREKEEEGGVDPGYGYFGGLGPRRSSNVAVYRTRKAYEYDEPQGRRVVEVRKKRVYDYDETPLRTHSQFSSRL